MQSFFSFLPRGFSSLLDYISPAAFDVVDWAGALKRSAVVSRSLLFGSEVKAIAQQMQKNGLPLGVVLHQDWAGGTQAMGLGPALQEGSTRPVGELILELYFWQLLTQERCFLDLRRERFRPQGDGRLEWRPNGLWVEFSPWFRQGMVSVYCSFYDRQGQGLEEALGHLGLIPPGLAPDAKTRLLALLESHFGAGREGPMEFKVKNFVASFHNLFVFLKDEKIRLSEEFLFLGVLLLTLYLHLEALGESHNVAAAFGRVMSLQSSARPSNPA